MPTPVQIADLTLSKCFAYLDDTHLLTTALQPVTKSWRRQAVAEILRRDSLALDFFVSRYIDYMFKHHMQIVRKDFIALLTLSGVLNRWHQLSSEKSSLLFGAAFWQFPEKALGIAARIFNASSSSEYWKRSWVEQPKLTNLLISLYCLAEDDLVRENLFRGLLAEHDKELGVAEVLLHCLVPYLLPNHLKRWQTIVKKFPIKAYILDNLSAEERVNQLCMNDRALIRPTDQWLEVNSSIWRSLTFNNLRVPDKILNRVIPDEFKIRLLKSVVFDDYTRFINDAFTAHQVEGFFERLLPSLATMNLRENFTREEYAKLIHYCNKKDQANAIRLLLHPHIKYLSNKSIFYTLECIFHILSFHFYQEYPGNLGKNFHTLFLRLPIGDAKVDLHHFFFTQHGFMRLIVEITFSKFDERYGDDLWVYDCGMLADFRDNLFAYFSDYYKQYCAEFLIEKLQENKIQALFLLARIANGISNEQTQKIFAALVKNFNGTLADLPNKMTDNALRLLLVILYEIKEDITHIQNISVHQLIDNYYLKLLSTKEYIEFIKYYRPKLTSAQTSATLRTLIQDSTNAEIRDCDYVIAGLGKNLKPEHLPLLNQLNSADRTRFYFKFMVNATCEVKPPFQSALVLREAIQATNGFHARNQHGLFKGKPNRDFRELQEAIDAMENGTVEIQQGYKQLKQQAQKIHAADLSAVILEREIIDLASVEQNAVFRLIK